MNTKNDTKTPKNPQTDDAVAYLEEIGEHAARAQNLIGMNPAKTKDGYPEIEGSDCYELAWLAGQIASMAQFARDTLEPTDAEAKRTPADEGPGDDGGPRKRDLAMLGDELDAVRKEYQALAHEAGFSVGQLAGDDQYTCRDAENMTDILARIVRLGFWLDTAETGFARVAGQPDPHDPHAEPPPPPDTIADALESVDACMRGWTVRQVRGRTGKVGWDLSTQTLYVGIGVNDEQTAHFIRRAMRGASDARENLADEIRDRGLTTTVLGADTKGGAS